MKYLYAPFGITIRRQKMAYCNNNVIPLMVKNNIEWDDYDTKRIIIKGRVFPMKDIENGDAEAFVRTLIGSRQTTLDEF